MATFANEWLQWAQNQAQPYLAKAQAHLTVSGPGVKPTLPPREFFKFPPADLPKILPPPTDVGPNFSPPFLIPTDWYNAALSPHVPITFALVYATVITYLNSVNQRRNKKPWDISRTRLFTLLVLIHNIFLSLYSLWTFLGMYTAMRVSVVNPREYGLAATVDSLCKMNGPRGHGSAATYNATTDTWSIANHMYRLGPDGMTPDNTDVGRIWNEGLAFYGWIFYISKFYEVVDTLIIIMKGKKSSFLQTYHHAGAMLCMWAGIRYMSPPIWMFVFVNSFIHFVMYAFYTVTTLSIKVPKPLKQTLTTLQITQFVVGASYAFAHYFVAYESPYSTSYLYHLGDVVTQAVTSVKPDISSALSVATVTASADVGSWLKKFALRAAGRQGLAENVENRLGQTFGVDAVRAVEDLVQNVEARYETRYNEELRWVHCLDTSGQVFAIYLNIFYLLPLTWLFLQFFIKSYLKRVDDRRRSSVTQKAYIAGQSIQDARKGISRRLSEAFEDYQGASGELNDEKGLVNGDEIREAIRNMADKTQKQAEKASETMSKATSGHSADEITNRLHDMYERMKAEVQSRAEDAKEAVQAMMPEEDIQEKIKREAGATAQSAKKSVENLFSEETTNNATDTAAKVEEKAEEISANAIEKAEELLGETKEKAEDVTSEAEKSIDEDKTPEVKQEEVEEDTKSPEDEPAKTQVDEDVVAKEEEEHDALVQDGKSFADAAAEGLSKEDNDEVRIADDSLGNEAPFEENAENISKEDLEESVIADDSLGNEVASEDKAEKDGEEDEGATKIADDSLGNEEPSKEEAEGA